VREERKEDPGGGLAIDLYEINRWEPIEDDKSILFSANHEARGESNGDY